MLALNKTFLGAVAKCLSPNQQRCCFPGATLFFIYGRPLHVKIRSTVHEKPSRPHLLEEGGGLQSAAGPVGERVPVHDGGPISELFGNGSGVVCARVPRRADAEAPALAERDDGWVFE